MFFLVLGTRPEIIKCSPVIRAFENQDVPYHVIHSGQHYSYEMDRVFFEELMLPAPGFALEAGSGSHGRQTARILSGVEEILQSHRPSAVLVQGDTNTVLAGALAAVKLHIPVAHIEAGLRSFDRKMPEEINRVVADHISRFLFAPTPVARKNLLSEGIGEEKIFVTGNTIVDAVYQNLDIARARPLNIPGTGGIGEGRYILATAHREENVDDKRNLQGILEGLGELAGETGMPVIFPVHPRTRKMMEVFSLVPDGIRLIPPIGYLEFLRLESSARLVLTDSGGVQEESCILHVPCVTLRENTERPETLDAGANVLAGTDPARIVREGLAMLDKRRDWKNPFGDGRAAERIAGVLLRTGEEISSFEKTKV
ncbi:MAG: UDP-N-acetylglucosamine 2-epimerase (non-hydrolyzing) [Methanolinea sp.]|nr:UDP-N-acetylglucosamine 2-epimerase (non-hydrolyzing) [Methanolinea sp.]